MFEFFNDFGNYSERKVDRFEGENFIIDTARVSDGMQPYETGINHPSYGGHGGWVIVESYPDKAVAQVGHDGWVKKMTADTLPPALVDCQNSGVSQFLGDENPDDLVFQRKD